MKKPIEKFEDIVAWQKSRVLVSLVYRTYKTCKDFGFKDQIQRASTSVMSNIAEGYERKGDKEMSKFLFIAKGSCGEVRSLNYIALDLGYIDEATFQEIHDLSIEITRITSAFIKSIN